jgi:hypothetical protein
MNRVISKLVIVVIILIAIVTGSIAIYYFLQNGTTKQDVFTVQNATSLQVSADVVGSNVASNQGVPNPFKWSVANIGTSNQKIRLTIYANDSDQTGFSYIVNSQNQAAWKNENGTWVSTNYDELNNLWGTEWTQTLNELKANWTGNGNVSFKNSFGDNVTVTNVVINPEIPDSTFEPTT